MKIEFLLNVFLFTFIISSFSYCLYIPYLRRKNKVQVERILGPITHKHKNFTPSLGGVVFVTITILNSLIIFGFNYNWFLSIFCLISFFIIGHLDDTIIIKTKSNDGLKGYFRIFLELISSICFLLLLYNSSYYNTTINIFNGYYLNLGYLYIPFVILLLISTSNSSNITDGIDGLVSGISIISIICIFIIAIKENNYYIIVISITLIASILSYFTFNCTKAKIFMGDSGSLALGGYICSCLVILKKELLIILICAIYIIETLSVIFQVLYFKLTKGKRLFKMAPIHHHFELVGLSELKIDILFWLISIITTLICILLIK